MQRMSLLIVTSGHPIDDKRVHHKFASSFVNRGWEVTWLGPNKGFTPAVSDGIEYRLLRPVDTKRERLAVVPRLISQGRTLRQSPNWIYCPDPDAMAAALRLARFYGSRLIFDIHEMFHTTHIERWAGNRGSILISGTLASVIRWMAYRADLVVSPSPQILETYASDRPETSTLLLHNTVPTTFAESADRERALIARPSPDRLMHGKVGVDRGTRELAHALVAADDIWGAKATAVAFAEPEELAAVLSHTPERIRRRASDYFECHPPISHEVMPSLLAGCAAGVIGYTGAMAGPNLGNRTFEYMAASLPVPRPDPISAHHRHHQSPSVWNLVLKLQDHSLAEAIACVIGRPNLCGGTGHGRSPSLLGRLLLGLRVREAPGRNGGAAAIGLTCADS